MSGVRLVVTRGDAAMDRYGQDLAAALGAPVLETDVHQRSAEEFGWPLVSRRAARALAADVAFVRRLRRTPGLLHFANHHLARYGPLSGRPYVVTVHDLIRHRDAWGEPPLIDEMNLRDRLGLAADRHGILRAAGLVAVSRWTRRELVERLGLPAERIAVAPPGIDHARFRPVAPARPVQGRWILYVGSEHRRKDLPTLLRALGTLRADPLFADVVLVKAGAAGRPEARYRPRTLAALHGLGLEHAVRFIGHAPDAELPALYAGAACVVLPSRAEGVGLPALEAMACGTPVIVSDAGALPEITGGVAPTFPVGDDAALAAVLRRVLGEPQLRERLAEQGRRHALTFTWAESAQALSTFHVAVRAGLPAVTAPAGSTSPR
ncbi:MAG: glycosyl transferase, group 1 [Conexibacter sp.]|nr:glycosyl transferase, group 1 [Conexibacter sp.]